DHAIAAALDRRAEDRLGCAVGIHVGGVEEVDAGIETDVDDASRLLDVGIAPGAEQRPLAAEGAGAEPERRHLQARGAEVPVFHRRADAAHAAPPVSCTPRAITALCAGDVPAGT